MSKRQLIDDIRRYNYTAQPQFLAQFDETALKQYLEHLEEFQGRSGVSHRVPWKQGALGLAKLFF